jgi:hypothetical protein
MSSESRLSISVAAAFAAAVLAAPLASQAAERDVTAAPAAASPSPAQSLKASPAAVQHLTKTSMRLQSTLAKGIWPEVTHLEAVA